MANSGWTVHENTFSKDPFHFIKKKLTAVFPHRLSSDD